ncbi:DUF3889 domain-containing protein [Bacillus sp. AFS017336]|uniref:DUF3889 domain-containing protein n=1 Tax=Bacillus sp. AFS017336 TaxID=2033489 RepID=UPI000BF18C87|nr:DUF3889 domain-containing protein [Bacillus sp. AFS017336]PEL14354.1 hypothetical protein CN601_00320 [Bacillus sp. AFS017336]
MKKIYKVIFIFSFLLCIFSNLDIATAQQHVYEPPYAKWGKIAVEKTIQKYPQADVIDYLHIGREQKSPTNSIEKFKLWLRLKNGSREFGVFVNVEFETRTEKFIGISYTETDR